MADQKVTALAEETAALTSDILYLVDDPGGTPISKKITIANLFAAKTGEIFLTAAGGWPSTTLGSAANVQTEYGSNDVDLFSLDFDEDADEFAQWTVWMPDDWDAGTITAKFSWTAATGSGDVIWGLQGISYADSDPIDVAWGTGQTVTDTLLTAADIHYSPTTTAITLAGSPAAGELIQLRVYRDADVGGDTLTADARLLGVKVFYTRT